MHVFDRRKFLFATSSAALASPSVLGEFGKPKLYINDHDWMDIPFEDRKFEIVGSTDQGLTILPNFARALCVEARHISGLSVHIDNVHNVELIDSCGLFSVYISLLGTWRKYRLWNYISNDSLEHELTHAG
jgi:hypothetical protein